MLQKIKDHWLSQLFILACRYLIGTAFVFPSVVKILGGRFTAESGAEYPIDSAWHFFETLYASGAYWQFLGWAQLIAGGLLLSQRFARLGAVMFFPIITNIMVITLSYGFKGTPFITVLMWLANLALLVWDWPSLKVILGLPPALPEPRRWIDDLSWQVLGAVLFAFAALHRPLMGLISFPVYALIGLILGLAGLAWGLSRRRHYRLS